MKKWQEGQLQGHYAYLITDAAYFFLRQNHQVVKRPVLISIGIDTNGPSKILGVNIVLEE